MKRSTAGIMAMLAAATGFPPISNDERFVRRENPSKPEGHKKLRKDRKKERQARKKARR